MPHDNSRLPDMLIGQQQWDLHKSKVGPSMDLTNRIIEQIRIAGLNIQQSLLNGTLMRRGAVCCTDLSRSDLEACRFEQVHFDRVRFDTTDIRSTVFSKCTFTGCSFFDSYVDDVVFVDCTIEDTDFASSVFTGNELTNCKLTRVSFKETSNILCSYRGVAFSNMTLGDCTFQMHILVRCSFDNVRMNIDSLGYLYGISESDVGNLTFLFLGIPQPTDQVSGLIAHIIAEYEARNWNFALWVARINFRLSSVVHGLHQLLTILVGKCVAGERPVKNEVVFFEHLLNELSSDGRLPLLSVVEIVDEIGNLPRRADSGLTTSALQELNRVANGQLVRLESMLSTFVELLSPINASASDRVLTAQLTFHKQPTIATAKLINDLASETRTPLVRPTRLVQIHRGSVIEVLETSLYAMVLFGVLLYLIEGTVIQLTSLKERIRVLARRDTAPAFRLNALLPNQPLPDHLVVSLRSICEYVAKNPVLEDKNLGGFGKDNLQSVDVLEDPPKAQLGE